MTAGLAGWVAGSPGVAALRSSVTASRLDSPSHGGEGEVTCAQQREVGRDLVAGPAVLTCRVPAPPF